jgi:hypothetical protein
MSSQPKVVNHMIQGQQKSYYPIQFGHSQAMIPGPSPSYSYGQVAIYDPNQWRQNQQQTNFQQLQSESSMANSNPQGNNKQDNSPSTSMSSKGRIMTIIGGNSIDHENNNQKKNYF